MIRGYVYQELFAILAAGAAYMYRCIKPLGARGKKIAHGYYILPCLELCRDIWLVTVGEKAYKEFWSNPAKYLIVFTKFRIGKKLLH